MKKYFILLFILQFTLSSCMKDTSAYLPQTKKEVTIDQINQDNPNPEIPANSLSPGIHQIKIIVNHNGVDAERRFKYFMPVSIDRDKQISLIFDFHGSYPAGTDPIESISMSNPICQLAIKQNCIIVFPAGEDTGNAVNWQNTEYHLPFVDSMVTYFMTHNPAPDENRIYTCGHSSGAIFSFALAYSRSNIFAAAVPVSGQMKLTNQNVPSRTVPIRAFNGKNDDVVQYIAAKENITDWATIVGGYFPSDAKMSDTLKIDNYKKYLTMVWRGGKADIEFFTIIDEGHSINWYYILPMMWDFMNTHHKGVISSSLYISSELKSIEAMEGQSFSSRIKYTDGATVSLLSYPEDWSISYHNNILSVTAPSDFFASTTINRKGEIKLKAELNNASTVISIPISLKAPKTYYEIGDLVYDNNYQPLGVVFWVNSTNIKEAKIIAMEHVTRKFGPVGSNFFTPDFEDGYANTLALINRVRSAGLNLNASTSAFIYAYEYKASPGNTTGWYLPAVNELKALDENLAEVNNSITKNGGTPLQITSSSLSYHMSSTSVNGGTPAAPNKRFYTYDFHSNPSWHGYYIIANKADDTSYISTRPVKKVTK